MERVNERTGEVERYAEESDIILGLYFFLHPENSQQIRQADNIENLISYLGGLIEILLVSFIGLTTIYNQQTIVSKYLQKLYFTPNLEISTNAEAH